LDFLRHTNNLANIHVGAWVVDLWVIRKEYGAVDTSGCLDAVASVACFHDMDIGAVLPGEAQAEDLASFEIAALLVDARIVREELERGHILTSGDGVTVVTDCNGVATTTLLCGSSTSKEADCNEGSDRGEHSWKTKRT
jgi:hypothetical protein